MSTAPNGKVAQAAGPVAGRTTKAAGSGPTSAQLPKSASVDKLVAEAMAGKPGKKKKDKVPVPRNQMIAIVVAAVLVFGAGIGVYAYFNRPEQPIKTGPLVGAPAKEWSSFMTSSKFNDLTPLRKRFVLEEFADRKKEFEQLHATHQITDDQFREILPYAWVGKKFKEISNYNQKSEREKRDYVQHLIDKDVGGDDDPKGADGKEIKRDKKKSEEILSHLSSEDRAEIVKMERIIEDAKKERRRRDLEIKKANAAAAASRPTTRPGETPKTKPADPAKTK